MAKRRKTSDTTGPGSEDFVPVAVARTADQAEEFRHLLEDHDIPVMVGIDGEGDDLGPDAVAAGSVDELSRGIAVLVPEDRLDEAGEVIAEREGFDRFAEEDVDDSDDDDEEFGLADELPAGWSEQREDDDFVEDDDDSNEPASEEDEEDKEEDEDY
ncbi:MAG: putative signal transducing protein [Planctomycetota bacterium]|jgi:hypothetical protein